MKIQQGLLISAFALLLTACGLGTPVTKQKFDLRVYTVQTGDTVYSISWRYSQDFRDVIRWNNLSPPYTIYPGQKLSVHGPVQSVATAGEQQAARESVGGNVSESTTAKLYPLNPPTAPASKIELPQTDVTSQSPQTTDVTSQSSKKTDSGSKSWVWPVKGKLLSQFSTSAVNRQGIDIGGVEGAPVVASRSGKIVYSGSGMRDYGQLIIIKHSETFLSAYAHNSQLLVEEDDTIKAGQIIARIGVNNQGVAKLHFEIRKNGKAVNPLKYLPNN